MRPVSGPTSYARCPNGIVILPGIASVCWQLRAYMASMHTSVDQGNRPDGDGLERLCDIVRGYGGTRVWAVHAVSAGCYDRARLHRLMDAMGHAGIGLICCPSAALGMFQDRSITAPVHNSIAPVAEMYEAGIRIRLGADNICDMFSPSTTPDLLTEIVLASNATRFYNPAAWAEMAAGVME